MKMEPAETRDGDKGEKSGHHIKAVEKQKKMAAGAYARAAILSFKSAFAEDGYYSTLGSGTSIHWMPAVP